MYSIKKIKESLPKKKNSKSSIWVKIIIRKLSFIFTFIFINLGSSAWFASIFSIFVALTGSVLLCINQPIYRIIGMILVEFWLVMDCVDGNIARVKKESSETGEFIDALSGYYITAFVFLAIGVAAFNTSNIQIDKYIFIILGALTSITGILARLIHQKYTYTLMTLERQSNKKETLPEDEVENKKSIQYIRNRVDKEIGISGLFMPALIIATFLNKYDLLILFYFLFQSLGLFAVTTYYSLKAKK